MVKLTIDNREVEVPAGTNLVEAAAAVGIEIPTLCYLKDYEPSTSCQVCMVKIRSTGRLVPACGTKVTEGMEVDCDTEEVHRVRRTALELLFSEHVGDCRAPCDFACPAHMDIPLMMQQIGDQQLRDAIATIKQDIALPAVLGRVCPRPCEKGCRRKAADGPVAICDLKRFVADNDLASADPYRPPCKPDSGKQVAVVGGGPSGLAAVYSLRQAGHTCTLIEQNDCLGGRLRTQESEEVLPHEVLDAEIAQITRLGVELWLQTNLQEKDQLDDLVRDFDAVLLALGKIDPKQIEKLGLTAARKGIEIDRNTFMTSRHGVFAIGNALRGKGAVVRSVADGKEVASIIDRFLASAAELAPRAQVASRIGRMEPGELSTFLAGAPMTGLVVPERGEDYEPADAQAQSERCLSCTCASHGNCKLEYWAQVYGADPNRFPRERKPYQIIGRECSVQFEPGKCIKCELCIKIAEAAREPLGLSFVGRGFDVVLRVPFDRTLDEALTKVAADCVAACPTAALSFADHRRPPVLVQIEGAGRGDVRDT